MNNYENRPLLPMPFPKPLKEMTNEDLTKLLSGKFNYNVLIPGLIEAHLRKDEQIADLTKQISELIKRIAYLEQKALQKPGRKRREFYIDGRELTDEYLMQLIDEGYYHSISKFEKAIGAGKNQLRNHYNKAKKKLIQERKVQSYGNR